MKSELRDKIIAFNRKAALNREKADDFTRLLEEIVKLPPGQFKKMMTEPMLRLLQKHGVEI